MTDNMKLAVASWDVQFRHLVEVVADKDRAEQVS